VINEIAQWAVLAVMVVFVFGLTRQLGAFMVGDHRERAATQGPDLGKKAGAALVTETERVALGALMRERATEHVAVVAVDQRCPGCEGVISALETDGAERDFPVLAITRSADTAFEQRLRSVFDVVAIDEDRLRSADVKMTPFVLLLDRDFKVVHKAAAQSVAGAVAEWRADTGESIDPPELHVISVGISQDREVAS
jgi:hypothetical protein